MIISARRTRIFREGDNLFSFVLERIKNIPERSVIVVTSKIVALSERRTAEKKDKEKLIQEESEYAIQTRYVWLTIKDGHVMANAGIDESNADGKLILLPRDSFRTAATLRKQLQKKHAIQNLGILITDSRVAPLRRGITGVALGYAGFRGIKDYRHELDIFGRPFEYSTLNVADSLATAAVLCMGEGDEQRPLALITGAPVEFCERVDRRKLKIDVADDLYAPFFLSK